MTQSDAQLLLFYVLDLPSYLWNGCSQVRHINILRMTNDPQVGVVVVTSYFKFWGPNYVSGMSKARVIKFWYAGRLFQVLVSGRQTTT